MTQYVTCIVPLCGRAVSLPSLPYCDDHLPVGSFITNEQFYLARQLMRRGASLHQIAARLKCDSRDLDVALWQRITEPRRPEPMW